MLKEIKIPVVDEDSDIVKCRWSIDDECGISCEKPPNVELDEKKCMLKFNLPKVEGLYAIRLHIEDYANIISDSLLVQPNKTVHL